MIPDVTKPVTSVCSATVLQLHLKPMFKKPTDNVFPNKKVG